MHYEPRDFWHKGVSEMTPDIKKGEEHMTDLRKAAKMALEALEAAISDDKPYIVQCKEAITALREALAEQPAQQEPYCWMSPEGTIYQASDEDVLKGSIPMYLGIPAQQEPVTCPVCNQVHAILDADESQIIRNAKDGYPEGRTPRVLTLQERVASLCKYASDWKRWCLEKENTTPQPPAQQSCYCPNCEALSKELAEQPAQQEPVKYKCTVIDDAETEGEEK